MYRINLKRIFTRTCCKFNKKGLKNKLQAIFTTILVFFLLGILFLLIILDNGTSYINKNIIVVNKIDDKLSLPVSKEENEPSQNTMERNDDMINYNSPPVEKNEDSMIEENKKDQAQLPQSPIQSIPIPEEPYPTIESPNGNKMEIEVLNYINNLRNAVGVQKLTWDNSIYLFAKIRANEISNLYSHVRPNGTTSASSSQVLIRAENLAYGQVNSNEIFEDWKNSPSHYNNLVDSTYTKGAIAFFIKDEVYYWVFLAS